MIANPPCAVRLREQSMRNRVKLAKVCALNNKLIINMRNSHCAQFVCAADAQRVLLLSSSEYHLAVFQARFGTSTCTFYRYLLDMNTK